MSLTDVDPEPIDHHHTDNLDNVGVDSRVNSDVADVDQQDEHQVFPVAIFEWCQILMDSVGAEHSGPNLDYLLLPVLVLQQLHHCLLIGYSMSIKKRYF